MSNLDLRGNTDLTYLAEEEKLARDVYKKLYKIHNEEDIFLQISDDEQIHMTKVLDLIKKQGQDDPIGSNADGVFNNQKIQKLYTNLVLAGSKNIEEGLKVSILLENVDIKDISSFKLKTVDKEELKLYDFLIKGSRSHNNIFTAYLNKTKTINSNKNIEKKTIFNILENSKEISGEFKVSSSLGDSFSLKNKNWGFSNVIFKNNDLKKVNMKFDLELLNTSLNNYELVIFDYVNESDFKYVGLFYKGEYWSIGHYQNKKWKHSLIKREIIKPDSKFKFEVEIDGGIVTLVVNGKQKLKKEFPTIFTKEIGISVYRSESKFRNFEISYDKSDFLPKILNIYDLKLTSNSGFNKMLEIILNDKGLNAKTPRIDILEAVYYADKTNKILYTKINELGLYDDKEITPEEVIILNKYLFDNYFELWNFYHGNDENGWEGGFHLVRGDGGTTKLFNKNAIDTVIDGIYHLGYEPTNRNNAQNEDNNNNQKYKDLATWINYFLKYEDPSLSNLGGILSIFN